MDIGKNIKAIRKKQKMSQVDLSEKSGLRQGTISAIEVGTNKPNLDTLLLISHALGCTVSEIIGDSPSNKNDTITHQEEELLGLYRLLNAKGKERTIQMIQVFSMLPEYQKSGITNDEILAYV